MTLERAAWTLIVLLVFSVPWDRSVHLDGTVTLTRWIGIAAFAVGLAAIGKARRVPRMNISLGFAAAFCAYSALSLLWSVDSSATLSRAVTLAQLLAMTVLICAFCRTAGQLRQLHGAFVAGATVLSIMTLVRYGYDVQTYWRRYAAPGFDPNDTGVTIAIAIPAALYLAFQSERAATAWLWRGTIAIMIPAILVTASRTALVAAFLAFSFVLFTWVRSNWAHRWAGIALVALMSLSLVELAPAPARQRLQTLPSELTKGTLNKRTTIWKAGLVRFRERPVLGVGAGAFPAAVDPLLPPTTVAGHVNVAHNTFLSVLVECGVLGFALFGFMLLALAGFVWSMFNGERAFYATTLLVWAAGVSTVTWEHRKVTWLVFALIMAAWAIPLYKKFPQPAIPQTIIS